MKKLALLLGVFIMMACSGEDIEKIDNREYISTCYKFVEIGSETPMDGLSILIHYGYGNILSAQGITNNDGMWCFKHWNDEGDFATPYTYNLSKFIYNFPSRLPLNGSVNTFGLIPASSIKLHIMNIDPSSENDKIVVKVEFDTREYGVNFGAIDNREFVGKEIDTFYVSRAVKGKNIISWSVYSNGILQNTYSDTVEVEEFRQTVDYKIEY